MSGPKIDDLEIIASFAVQLEAERAHSKALARNTFSNIQAELQQAQARAARILRGESLLQTLKEAETQAFIETTQMASEDRPLLLEDLRTFNDRLSNQLDAYQRRFLADMQPVFDKLTRLEERQNELNELDQLADNFQQANAGKSTVYSTALADRLLADTHRETSLIMTDSQESTLAPSCATLDDTIISARNALCDISSLISQDTLDARRVETLTDCAQKIQQDLLAIEQSTENQSSLDYTLTLINPIISEMQMHSKVKHRLYLECVAAQEELLDHQVQIQPLPKERLYYSEQELEEQQTELIKLANEFNHRAYLLYALRCVMANHGYNITESIQLEPLECDGHSLFLSDASNIGIHTFVSNTGTVMMEVGAVDNAVSSLEKTPIRRTHVAAPHEQQRLIAEQYSFCELHPRILEELATYGISATNKSDKTPDADTCIAFVASQDTATNARSKRTQKIQHHHQHEQLEMRELI